MPVEENVVGRWAKNGLQFIGAAWSLVYAVMVYRYQSAYSSGQDFWTIVWLWLAPNACMFLTFVYFRTGGVLAAIVLAFATLLQLGEGKADMRGASQAISILLMLVGGPATFLRGLVVYRRRERQKNEAS
jgi:hypothetical protein